MNTTNNNDDLLNDDPEQASRRNITKSDDMPDYELEDPDDILNDDVDDFIDEDMDIQTVILHMMRMMLMQYLTDRRKIKSVLI